MPHPCYNDGCRGSCPYGAHFYECPKWQDWAAEQHRQEKNPMNQTMENSRPWDDPKVQMMLQMFNGVITAVTPLNIREVNSDGTTR